MNELYGILKSIDKKLEGKIKKKDPIESDHIMIMICDHILTMFEKIESEENIESIAKGILVSLGGYEISSDTYLDYSHVSSRSYHEPEIKDALRTIASISTKNNEKEGIEECFYLLWIIGKKYEIKYSADIDSIIEIFA